MSALAPGSPRSDEHPCCATCTAHEASPWSYGTVVKVQRDESRWPSRGTWPRFRGRVGTVVQYVHGEYGVSWDANPHPTKEGASSWFLPHELKEHA